MKTNLRQVARLILFTAIFSVYLHLSAQPSFAADDMLPLACTASQIIVEPGDSVTLNVFTRRYSTGQPPPSYTWTATGGTVDNGFPTAQWSFAGQAPGQYTATIRIEDPQTGTSQCSINIIVGEDKPPKPFSRSGLPRETGSDLLHSDQREPPKYGLYTYLLLGAPPNEHNKDKYIQLVRTFLRMVPEINRLEKYIPPSQLNVAYLPVTHLPAEELSGDSLESFVLENYDYARSRAILRLIPGVHRDGPYVLSTPYPISGQLELKKPYLEEDLTLFPADMVESVFKEYLVQAANEAFYEERSLPRLALNIRATVNVLAGARGPIETALRDWLKLVE